ncbi:DarT1-associated NADAR antitoxin family protein [Paenibacillus elgii]|uniref:DarT1-associated NADAR antitoxin family protein n=1 Tax=Paenibacillus elgii TaxID=189691 RepID=UPI003F7E62AF
MLECSSKGDKRFSAFYAKVVAWNKLDSIENHYQLCKRFGEFKPSSWKGAKGKQPTHIELNGKQYDLMYLSQWYKMLWVKYLDDNPELVEYAKGFDDFNDIFKGKSLNCQADVIRQYIKQGRESLVEEYQELVQVIKRK